MGQCRRSAESGVEGGVGGWCGGGEGGGGVGGGGGRGGGGCLGTHWKPLNTSKTLARAARVVGSVGGWRGGENGGGGVGLGTLWKPLQPGWWALHSVGVWRGSGENGGGGGGGEGLGTHWKALSASKTLARRPSEDNGRGAVGAVREGGDDVEWVGKALTAVGRRGFGTVNGAVFFGEALKAVWVVGSVEGGVGAVRAVGAVAVRRWGRRGFTHGMMGGRGVGAVRAVVEGAEGFWGHSKTLARAVRRWGVGVKGFGHTLEAI